MTTFCKYIFILLLLIPLSSCQNKTERMEVKKQKVGPIELAYYTRGEGEPLVLVMGFRGTMAGWDPGLIDELAKNYKVILFDSRGVGMSTDTLENNTTISQMAADTLGLIKALGYEKVHLLGWSMGSMIGMQLAIEYPEILKSLILCSPNPGGKYQVAKNTDADSILSAPELSTEDALSLIFPDTNLGRLAAASFVARAIEAIQTGRVPNDLDVKRETVERQNNAMQLRAKDNTIYAKLKTVKVPTLVAGGLEDILDSPENARTVASQIPSAWTAYFPDAGHAFLSQDYLEFSRLVNIFINTASL